MSAFCCSLLFLVLASGAVAEPPAQPEPEPPPKLPRFKLTGYVQGRFVWSDASPPARDGFTVRRARVKAEYMAELGGVMLQLDGSPRGVALRDAEARLVEPWTGQKLELALGQMKWPFGHDVIQSSSERELPERARVIRAFFPGERDRGVRLSAGAGPLRLQVGVFDGNGIEDRQHPGADNDRHKDVVGRMGLSSGWLSFGLSGWLGRTLATGPGPAGERTFPRNRLGADLQLRPPPLPIGQTLLKLEAVVGRSYFQDGVEQHGASALGGYALLVQRLGARHALALRYDLFDAAPKVHTFGAAWILEWSEAVKLTVAYELADSLLTLQLQGRY